MALEYVVGQQDVEILHNLTNILKDSKIEVLSKANETKLQSYTSMFKDMTLDEAKAIIERQEYLVG